MPEFYYRNKLYYNPVEFAMDRIGGTWKMPILWRLKDKVMRYGELKKAMPRISDKMLTSQLKELEEEGFIKEKFTLLSLQRWNTQLPEEAGKLYGL